MKAIDKKYCKEGLVQLMNLSDMCNFIVSPNEIILLKSDGKIIVNNYEGHPKRYSFPFSERIITNDSYHGLFEYNKPYLNFSGAVGGYRLTIDYFVKDNDRAILYETYLSADKRTAEENTIELTRDEIEEKFNKDLYDSMYVIDISGKILFANNKVNGLVIDNNIIPTNEEIVALDAKERVYEQDLSFMARRIGHVFDETYVEEEQEEIKPRNIEEIKNLNIYSGGLFKDYHHILLTSKGGMFSVQWFKLEYVEKDKFKMSYSNIPVIVPDSSEILEYAGLNKIESMHEPVIKDDPITEHIKSITKEEPKDSMTQESQGIRKLARIIKRNFGK